MSVITKLYRLFFCMGGLLTLFVPAMAAENVDDLPILTGGVVPIISFKEHDPFASGQLSSISHVEYVIRVKIKQATQSLQNPLF